STDTEDGIISTARKRSRSAAANAKPKNSSSQGRKRRQGSAARGTAEISPPLKTKGKGGSSSRDSRLEASRWRSRPPSSRQPQKQRRSRRNQGLKTEEGPQRGLPGGEMALIEANVGRGGRRARVASQDLATEGQRSARDEDK
uniref:Uncharacterized protein n=2 Tax=Ixodes scapularis TaxID=6945 RepID=A0A1S4KSB9_IXOSC